MDLSALRAAVLNSRKNLATSVAVADSSVATPVANATQEEGGATTAPPTPATSTTSTTATSAVVTATTTTTDAHTKPFAQANGKYAWQYPSAIGLDSPNTTESDKEEGEISDEDTETTEPTSHPTPTGTTPIAVVTQPNATFDHSDAQQRPTTQDYRLQQQPSGGLSHNNPNAIDSGRASTSKPRQGSDFTSLVAEYELSKAMTDSRSQPAKSKTPEAATNSDNPGLGQLKHRERSLPPMDDAFRTRNRPDNRSDNYYGAGS
ncbi:hypothetical protein BGZ95_004644, partial [Linnemannia exigua]